MNTNDKLLSVRVQIALIIITSFIVGVIVGFNSNRSPAIQDYDSQVQLKQKLQIEELQSVMLENQFQIEVNSRKLEALLNVKKD